jgi:arsenate reductase
MSNIIFYTKTGCVGGAKQKALLIASGHQVEERSLLDTKWTPEVLNVYFDGLDIKQWYNKNAPAVKSGKVVPGELPEKETLELLCSDPILIMRPLMEIDGKPVAGFNTEALSKLIELKNIPKEDLTKCQMNAKENPCKVAE